MSFFLDCMYIMLLVLGAPFILVNRKLRKGLWVRLRVGLTGRRFAIDPGRGTILVHCVSVGEVAAAVSLIESLESAFQDYQVVVSTTTPQGMETAKKKLHGRTLTYFPFDFSLSVARFLDRLSPDLIVLMELEAWPNFLRAAQLRKIPVILANGRMTEISLRRYMKLSFFTRDVFSRIDKYLVQTDEYSNRFLKLGVPETRITVAGNIKYDSVRTRPDENKLAHFRKLFDIRSDDEVLIGGSTYAKEEEILAGIYKKLKSSRPSLRLIIAPRQLDRLGEVKSIIKDSGLEYVLRSELDEKKSGNLREQVVVLDTVGELADIYALGTIVFVGGSLIDRGGHNMIEPAALGIPTLFGPNTYHFNQSTRFLINAQGTGMVRDAEELEEMIQILLNNPQMRERVGENTRQAVIQEKGAVDRHTEEIGRLLR